MMSPFSGTCPLRQRAGKSPELLWRIWSFAVPYCNFTVNSKHSFKERTKADLFVLMSGLAECRLKGLPLVPAFTRLTYKLSKLYKIEQRVPVKMKSDALDFEVVRPFNVATQS